MRMLLSFDKRSIRSGHWRCGGRRSASVCSWRQVTCLCPSLSFVNWQPSGVQSPVCFRAGVARQADVRWWDGLPLCQHCQHLVMNLTLQPQVLAQPLNSTSITRELVNRPRPAGGPRSPVSLVHSANGDALFHGPRPARCACSPPSPHPAVRLRRPSADAKYRSVACPRERRILTHPPALVEVSVPSSCGRCFPPPAPLLRAIGVKVRLRAATDKKVKPCPHTPWPPADT